MKIALTISEGRIAPVFEASRRVLVVTLDAGEEVSRASHTFESDSAAGRIRWLIDAGMNVVICGGIMSSLTEMLKAGGVGVVDGARGNIEDVLTQYRTRSGG